MNILINIFFWLGIMALVDGSLGLLFQEKWQKMVEQWNIQKIALIEIGIAWCLLAAYFLLRFFGAG